MKSVKRIAMLIVLTALAASLQAQAPTKLTSHTELSQKLNALAVQSKIMELEVIGQSVEGRELYAAQFSLNHPIPTSNRKKPLVLIFAQQHGNEPSGKEAALLLCQEIAEGKHRDLLKNLDVIIVPQMNPDGGERGVRRNASNADLNRDHILLSQPETRALHELFFRFWPEVTLDVHEYNDYTRSRMAAGYVRAVDEMFGAVTNPNASPEIKSFQLQAMLPEIGRHIEKAGFSFHRYLVGGPPEQYRYRYSTTYINDGRNSFGVLNTISFIVEGRRYGDLSTKLQHRTLGQRSAILALLKSVANHKDEIMPLVERERKQVRVGAYELLAPRSNYLHVENIPLKLRVERVADAATVDTTFKNFTPTLHVPFFLKRPVGYLIPKSLTNWLDVMKRQHIVTQDPPDEPLLIERYTIKAIGIFEMEEKQYLDIKTESSFHKERISREKFVYVSVAQPAGNFICLVLEPASVMCLAQYPGFLNQLRPGMHFPILRVVSER